MLKIELGLPTQPVIKANTYEEAKNEYGSYMDKRIKIQLELNKQTKASGLTTIMVMPRFYKMKTKITQKDCDDFSSLSDEDTKISKWLDKKGFLFETAVLYAEDKPNVFMLTATLVPKIKG